MQKEFEILPHTADLQIRAYGSDYKMLFANMLKGMFTALGPIVDDSTVGQRHPFHISSSERELLLVDFLSEALYRSDVYGEAYLDVEIEEISDTHIKGVFNGTPVTDFAEGEIKAVTHHGLRITQGEDGVWVAEVLFDI